MAVEMSRLARLQMAELEHVSPTTIVCFDSATGSVTPGTAVVSPRTTITNSIGPAILVTGNTPVEVILSGLTEFAPFKRFPTEVGFPSTTSYPGLVTHSIKNHVLTSSSFDARSGRTLLAKHAIST